MFCNHCGGKVPDIAKFCQQCGLPVSSDSSAVRQSEERQAIRQPAEPARAGTWRCHSCGRLNRPGTSSCACNQSQQLAPLVVPPTTKEKAKSSEWSVTNIAASIGGILLGRYVGVNFLIPSAALAFLWWLFNRTVPGPAHAFVPAAAIQGGHAVWIVVGLLAVGGTYDFLDVLLISGGLVWLIASPGIGPVIFLVAYQVAVLFYNLHLLADADVGSFVHRALVMHMALRVAAITYLVIGYRTLRHPRTQDVAVP